MKILVVSHTAHYRRDDGTVTGWGPTVREISWLARRFGAVTHVAPLHAGPPPASSLPYETSRVRHVPVSPAGGIRMVDKFGILGRAPEYITAIRRHMADADLIHVRCPANISLLSLLVLSGSARPVPRWIKYAGNWRPDGGEPRSYAFQRWWLRRGPHRGVVTVNGSWQGEPNHVVTFANPSLSRADLERAAAKARGKTMTDPVRVLFVGRLNAAKGAARALDIAAAARALGVRLRLDMVGDGPDRALCRDKAAEHGLGIDSAQGSPGENAAADSSVRFHGWMPRDGLNALYEGAQFMLLPSASEGWPKVLSEAMAYGVVPLASAVSGVETCLRETGAGLAFPPDDVEGPAAALAAYASNVGSWKAASEAGVRAGDAFTYETYLESVETMIRARWPSILARDGAETAPC